MDLGDVSAGGGWKGDVLGRALRASKVRVGVIVRFRVRVTNVTQTKTKDYNKDQHLKKDHNKD